MGKRRETYNRKHEFHLRSPLTYHAILSPQIHTSAHTPHNKRERRRERTQRRTWDISPVKYKSALTPFRTEDPEPAQIAMVLIWEEPVGDQAA